MDVEIEQPHLAHEHLDHQHVRRHWSDFAIPVSALFVSLISIFIAWQHGEVMKQLVQQNAKLVQANSLPYLGLDVSTATQSGEPWIRFMATNSGVGPAKIRSVIIKVDDRPVTNPRQLLAACCGGTGGIHHFGTSTLLGRMVRAGDMVTYLDFGASSKTDVARKFLKAYTDNRITISACYCSVFDDCWEQRSSAPVGVEPKPVKACIPSQNEYSW